MQTKEQFIGRHFGIRCMTTLRNELPTSPATGGLQRLVSNRINFAYMYAALKCFKAKRK